MPDRDRHPDARACDESGLGSAPAPDGAPPWADPDDPDPGLLRSLESLRPAVPADVAARHLARLTAVPGGRAGRAGSGARRRAVRAGTAGAVLALTLAGGVGIAAAADSRPGDPLYGLKTARERLQLAMARDGDGRAALELKFARTRLDEAAHLLRAGDVGRAVATLARADAALAAARTRGSAAIDDAAAAEVDRRVAVLTALLDGGLPASAADAARDAIQGAVDRGAARRHPPGRTPAPHPKPTDTARPTPRPTEQPVGRPDRTPGERPDGRPSQPGRGNPGGRGRR